MGGQFKYIPLGLSAHLTYFRLLLLWMLHIARCKGIEDFCFDGNYEDRRLNSSHILQHLHAKSGLECIFLCMRRDECCKSVNFRKNSHCEKNCELLHETAVGQPDLLVEHHDYEHYVLLQPIRDPTTFKCPDSRCLNGGRCVGSCENTTSFCECLPNYGGKYCNKSCADALRFRGNNIVEYGIFTGPLTNLTSITVCFWMSATGNSGSAILSYAYTINNQNFSNGLLINLRDAKKLEIYFHPYAVEAVPPVISIGLVLDNADKFHHVCVTWQSSDGQVVVYVDGSNVHNTTIGDGKILPGGGKWVIGQDQDKIGGDFEPESAFSGEIAEVHIWNKVLSSAEIGSLASSCFENLKGNYVAFSDFVMEGNVSRFQPPCCK